MFPIDTPSAATTRPPTTAPGTPGYFTDGNAQLAQQPTILPAEWLNGLQDELLNILAAAGIAPDKSKFNQLVQALPIISGGSSAGSKNKLINGNFTWWQRGTSLAAYQAATKFCADRWATTAMGTTIAVSQQAFVAGQTAVPGGPTFYHRCTVASVAGAGNFALMIQRIEGIEQFSGTTYTLSFWAKADAARPISFELQKVYGTGGTATDNAVATGVFQLTAAWQKFNITFPIPSNAGKTITGGNDCLIINFWFDAGSSFAARSPIGQQSGTFDVARVQLEPGSSATSFEVRQLATELALCQRFFEKSYDPPVAPGTITTAGITYNFITTLPSTIMSTGLTAVFKVTKRAVPTVTWYSPATGAVARVRDSPNNADVVLGAVVNSTTNSLLNVTMAAASGQLNMQGHWTADAEL